MKIGVIADTHIPDAAPRLPSRVKQVFRNMDIILHAGDICDLATLEELERITITMAVSGNRDNDQVRQYVEASRVVEFANRRIGMIHGNRSPLIEFVAMIQAKLLRKSRFRGLYDSLAARFPDVDCVVFGHTHQPYAKVHNGILLFNPGTIIASSIGRPSVGILNVTQKSITGRIVYI